MVALILDFLQIILIVGLASLVQTQKNTIKKLEQWVIAHVGHHKRMNELNDKYRDSMSKYMKALEESQSANNQSINMLWDGVNLMNGYRTNYSGLFGDKKIDVKDAKDRHLKVVRDDF